MEMGGGNETNEVEVIGGNEEERIIGCEKSTLMLTFAAVSDTLAVMLETGTASVNDLVTNISSGIVVVGEMVETFEIEEIIGVEVTTGEVEAIGVSGTTSLSEESSLITSFRLYCFSVICFATS